MLPSIVIEEPAERSCSDPASSSGAQPTNERTPQSTIRTIERCECTKTPFWIRLCGASSRVLAQSAWPRAPIGLAYGASAAQVKNVQARAACRTHDARMNNVQISGEPAFLELGVPKGNK